MTPTEALKKIIADIDEAEASGGVSSRLALLRDEARAGLAGEDRLPGRPEPEAAESSPTLSGGESPEELRARWEKHVGPWLSDVTHGDY
jgi:hypothetical protein